KAIESGSAGREDGFPFASVSLLSGYERHGRAAPERAILAFPDQMRKIVRHAKGQDFHHPDVAVAADDKRLEGGRWCLRGNVAGRADPVPITRRILPSEIRETVVLADAEHLQVWIVPRCEQAEGTDRLRRVQKKTLKTPPRTDLLAVPPHPHIP